MNVQSESRGLNGLSSLNSVQRSHSNQEGVVSAVSDQSPESIGLNSVSSINSVQRSQTKPKG